METFREDAGVCSTSKKTSTFVERGNKVYFGHDKGSVVSPASKYALEICRLGLGSNSVTPFIISHTYMLELKQLTK